jgi:hypothetical protein
VDILTYIIVNLFLFVPLYMLLFRERARIPFTDRIIGTIVLGLAQIISTEMVLGVVFGKLYAVPLFILNISLSGTIMVFTLSKGEWRAGMMEEIGDEISHVLTIIRRDRVLVCVTLLLMLSLSWIVFLGYLFPSYTWDAIWYHLPMIGFIMQDGSIQENTATFFIEQFINIFPKNIELLFIWNTIFLKDDTIIDLSQLLFTVLGIAAVYSMARKLGIREKSALLAALLFFFTPIVILQSTTNYVDVAVSVLFLVSINFLLHNSPERLNYHTDRVSSENTRAPLLLSGLTTGILLGSKGSGPLFVIILSSAFFLQEIARHIRWKRDLRGAGHENFPAPFKNHMKNSLMKYLLFFMLPVLTLGGYWYIKNWLLYGSPVYPMEISLFNVTIFKGLYAGIIDPAPELISYLPALKRPLYVWLERVGYYLYDSRFSGFGPLWFILFLPSTAFVIALGLIRKRTDLLFAALVLVVTFVLHPRNWNTRYVIFIVGLGAISFGLVLDYFHRRERILRFFALILAGYTFLASNSPCITPRKIGEFLRLPAHERTIARHAPFNIDLQARQEYGYWNWISENVKKGETIAYTFEPLFHAPLWNREFSNRVVYAGGDSLVEWLKTLRDEDVTYTLIRARSREDKWIQKDILLQRQEPDNEFYDRFFQVEYVDRNYKIVRFHDRRGDNNEG